MVEMLGGVWSGYLGGADRDVPEADTRVALPTLQTIAQRITTVPPTFHPHKQIKVLLDRRRQMGEGKLPLDWGMGEALAFASLVWDGRLVRMSGQDSRRGTFSHRHAVVVDQRTAQEYEPLEHISPTQAPCRIYDSPLSEAAVLGFEFGYSLDYPDALVAWEAQFGDFVNGAQVIIDQYISSSEDKWHRLSGLTVLLPHGYEGQGPEHSSARYERFLELAAEDNMQIVYPTTPAQFFHLLRRQVLRKLRKPLIVMTPKSLLRHPRATSTLDELTNGRFEPVLNDGSSGDRVIITSGKVYYDLLAAREERNSNVRIIRLEQFYPFPQQMLLDAIGDSNDVVWVQEEPRNMGAWPFLAERLPKGTRYVGRPISASPATGSHHRHEDQQTAIIDAALA
jgi:2-oxoglutarate dehydrogenase E1 component